MVPRFKIGDVLTNIQEGFKVTSTEGRGVEYYGVKALGGTYDRNYEYQAHISQLTLVKPKDSHFPKWW